MSKIFENQLAPPDESMIAGICQVHYSRCRWIHLSQWQGKLVSVVAQGCRKIEFLRRVDPETLAPLSLQEPERLSAAAPGFRSFGRMFTISTSAYFIPLCSNPQVRLTGWCIPTAKCSLPPPHSILTLARARARRVKRCAAKEQRKKRVSAQGCSNWTACAGASA